MKITPVVGLLGLLTLTACGKGLPEGPNIILITPDTTRADHLGCYGYERATSPQLDKLAKESVVFERAYAVSSWTMPTHASLFTGKYPSAHGAKYNPEGVLKLTHGISQNPAWDKYRANPIADNEVTLAAILSGHGYATGGVAGGPWMKKPFRLNKGFQFYDDDNITELNGRDAKDLTEVAKGFIDRNSERPFFLFMNYYDAHGPFVPRGEYLKKFRNLGPAFESAKSKVRKSEELNPEEHRVILNAFYDSEIAYVDAYLGQLFDHLRAKGIWEDTWIIITADHGELMGDPLLGESALYGHGNSLSEAEIRIPMIVKFPGKNARTGRDNTPVQQTDVMPSILKELGIELPAVLMDSMQGVPFDRQSRRAIFSEVYPLPMMNAGNQDWRHKGNWRVLLDGNKKFTWGSNGRNYLIDLATDPEEKHNLLQPGSEEEKRMTRLLNKLLKGLPKPGGVGDVDDLPDDVINQLKGLGYLGDDN